MYQQRVCGQAQKTKADQGPGRTKHEDPSTKARRRALQISQVAETFRSASISRDIL
jgi:hypothetical protein